MSRAEEDDDEHKEDDSSEKDILPSELESVTRSDIKWLMTGMNMVAEDLKSMKEKQQQFEEILLGTTVPEKNQQKKSNQKEKLEAVKKIKMIANQNLVKARRAWILQTAVVMTIILLLPAILHLYLKVVQILI